MPQIGSEKNPVHFKTKGNKKIGLSGSFYSKERKQNYNDNYDRIFNNAKKTKEAK